MDIYRLDVLEIPTNRPVDRTDEHDEVYRTLKEKSRAIVAEIADCHRRGQPILVGTVSIEKSEILSGLLKDRKYIRELGLYLKKQADGLKPGKEDELKAQLNEVGDYLVDLAKKNSGDPIPHQVLNARYHEQEAHIIAQAGVPGTVTIATNMAGRGTDIQLGGNDRYGARDWLKEEIEAGRMGAVHDAGDSIELGGNGSTTSCATATSGSTTASRSGSPRWRALAEWTAEEAGSGREPGPKEIAKKRPAHRGRAARPAVAEVRAEIAKEYAKIQAGRHNRAAMATSCKAGRTSVCAQQAREWLAGRQWRVELRRHQRDAVPAHERHWPAPWARRRRPRAAQPGAADVAAGAPPSSGDARADRGQVRRDAGRRGRRRSRRRSTPAGSTCSAPSGTRAGASTTSCAAAPAARAIRAAPSSICRSKTT